MKKFKFKLEAVLKLREFKEEKAKIELGQINKEIAEVQQKIEDSKLAIEDSFLSQEKILAKGVSVRIASFFPYFNEAHDNTILYYKNKLIELNKLFKSKVDELNHFRAEAKLIDNMKTRSKQEFKKEKEKDIQSKIDEIVVMRTHKKEGKI